jgi:hypothetical protein
MSFRCPNDSDPFRNRQGITAAEEKHMPIFNPTVEREAIARGDSR